MQRTTAPNPNISRHAERRGGTSKVTDLTDVTTTNNNNNNNSNSNSNSSSNMNYINNKNATATATPTGVSSSGRFTLFDDPPAASSQRDKALPNEGYLRDKADKVQYGTVQNSVVLYRTI